MSEPWCDARQYLADRAAEVEALIAGMPPEKQDKYRSSSKPHHALAAFDALVAERDSTLTALRHLSIVLTNGWTDDATKLSVARRSVEAQRRALAHTVRASHSQASAGA